MPGVHVESVHLKVAVRSEEPARPIQGASGEARAVFGGPPALSARAVGLLGLAGGVGVSHDMRFLDLRRVSLLSRRPGELLYATGFAMGVGVFRWSVGCRRRYGVPGTLRTTRT